MANILPFIIREFFISLRGIIEVVKQYSSSPEKIPEKLDEPFFSENNFSAAWDKIIRNTPAEPDRVEAAFHIWFDAFRNLKYIHFPRTAVTAIIFLR